MNARERFLQAIFEHAYQACRRSRRHHATHEYKPIPDGSMISSVRPVWRIHWGGWRLATAARFLRLVPREQLAAGLDRMKATLTARGIPEWFWSDEDDPLAAQFVAESLVHLWMLAWQEAGYLPSEADLDDRCVLTWLHTRQIQDLESRPLETCSGIIQQLTLL